MEYPREINDTDVYGKGKTFIKDALHLVNNNIEEINDGPDYDYAEVYYFREFNEILYLIFDYPHKHYTFKYFEV